jgi:hypothetical protein
MQCMRRLRGKRNIHTCFFLIRVQREGFRGANNVQAACNVAVTHGAPVGGTRIEMDVKLNVGTHTHVWRELKAVCGCRPSGFNVAAYLHPSMTVARSRPPTRLTCLSVGFI